MIIHLDIFDEFGAFCGNGEAAARFRFERIEPYVGIADRIELDFAGVRNANSSFCNVLIANLVAQHGAPVLKRIRFLNCGPTLQVMLRAAVDLGLSQSERAQLQQA